MAAGAADGAVVDGEFSVDNSTLRAVAQCSTQALLRYGWGYTTREEHAALMAGRAVHAALDVYLDPTWANEVTWVKAAALGILKREYEAWSRENVSAGDRLAYENVAAVLAAWIDTHGLGTLPFLVEQTELGFKVPLADGINFVGRLDAIARSRLDGRRWVVEHKTTGRITGYWTQQWQWSSQLTGYAFGAQRTIDESVVGVFVNAIELSKLPSADNRRCRDHGTMYRECGHLHAKAEITPHGRTPEAIATWHVDAIRLAQRFRQLTTVFVAPDQLKYVPMEGTFHNACQFCQFKDFCAGGRTERSLPLLLVHDPWEPLEGVVVREVA